MQFNLHPDGKQGTLELSGEINLLQAREFLALLNQALEASDRVVIDIEGIADIDTAGIQLLCAAHKSAIDRDKELIMDLNQSDVVASRITQTGLWRQQQCNGMKDEKCLWMGGNK